MWGSRAHLRAAGADLGPWAGPTRSGSAVRQGLSEQLFYFQMRYFASLVYIHSSFQTPLVILLNLDRVNFYLVKHLHSVL